MGIEINNNLILQYFDQKLVSENLGTDFKFSVFR